MNKNKMRIAAFGFRSLPSTNGSAGADKFAEELLPRLVKRGHSVVAYNRNYTDREIGKSVYNGVTVYSIKTNNRQGFDTLLHSFKCTCHIIWHNTADIVHIQNGGNSIFALFLRLFGKKVFLSQDGIDWKRDKWQWYAKLYLKISTYLSAHLPNTIIFDNVIAKTYFENKFKRVYEFIPFGSEVKLVELNSKILEKYNLEPNGYYLFVGRFIPDKGLHYLIPAFLNSKTNKKLVLVGGSPNPSQYENKIIELGSNENIVFTGYVYGDDVQILMRSCYAYIQPSDVEGLSPVVLTVMGLGIPMIVSDIPENIYAVKDTAQLFKKGDINSLTESILNIENNREISLELAKKASIRAKTEFNWENVADMHIEIFSKY